MKKILAILCAVILVLSCIPAGSADAGWQQAYLDVLKETVLVWEPQVDDIAVLPLASTDCLHGILELTLLIMVSYKMGGENNV